MAYCRYPPTSGGGGGSGTVTQVNTGTGLTGGPITTTGTVSLANTAVTPATYGDATHVGQFTVDQQGRLTSAASVAITYPASGNLTDAGTDGIVITGGTGAVLGSGTSIAQHVADSTHNGYLSSTDWSTFNGKGSGSVTSVAQTVPAFLSITGSPVTTTGTLAIGLSGTALPVANGGTGVTSLGNLTDAGTDGIVITGGTGAVITSASIAQHVADSTHNGYLSSTDWSTFNGKQASGNYITALTGDVTATGPGSVAATIAVGAVTDTKGSLANKPSVTVVATTNQALTGTPTIDGQATAVGSIILLTAQSSGAENGPWVAAAGAWSRPTWYPSGGTTQSFQFITTLVRLGSAYQGSTWRQTAAGPITIDTTATTWSVTPLAYGGLNTNSKISSVGLTIDGGGSPIATGVVKSNIVIPFACTITGWTILADTTGSIVIDIWKDTYANYPPTIVDTITGATKPTISASDKGQNLSLSGWITTVAAGDTLRFNVDSCSTITNATLTVQLSRTS